MTEDNSELTRLTKIIQGLGTTVEEVAATLDKEGIVGKKDDCAWCPIGKYLRIKGGYSDCVVLDNSIRVSIREGVSVHCRPTSAVSAFIRAFDIGLYPRLVKDW